MKICNVAEVLAYGERAGSTARAKGAGGYGDRSVEGVQPPDTARRELAGDKHRYRSFPWRVAILYPGIEMTERQIENRIAPIRDDLAALRQEISARNAPVAQRPNWLQRNPGAGAIIGAVVGSGLFGFGLPHLFDHSEKDFAFRVNANIDQKFRDNHFLELKGSVDQMVGELKTLSENVNILLAKTIKQAALLSAPDLKRQLPQLNLILNAAARDGTPADMHTIRSLYDNLLPLVKQNDAEAWKATVSLASYRTSLNVSGYPKTKENLPVDTKITNYYLGPHIGKTPTLSWHLPTVAPEQAARWDVIGHDQNASVKVQPQWLSAEGGVVTLDGEQIKNVVLQRVEVHYSGKSAILSNVTFINCTFILDRSDETRQFAAQVLASTNVSFQAE